jgi:acetyltransferase-like isoleucine patch superfamily enzyme
MEKKEYRYGELATKSKWIRAFRNLLLFPAWFCPVKGWRASLHRMRGVNIGNNVEIGYMTLLDNRRPELITIGDNAYVCAMSVVLTHDLSKKNREGTEVVGAVEIGEGAFIGMNSTILPGVRIGAYSIVAAGSVVNADVEPYSVVGGVPAKRIDKQ